MSKRIGERLVERGVIDRAQLDKALKAQLIMGGHLGTTLIELGFVEERTLADTLAEMHRLKAATSEMLQEISVDVLGRISPSMAERHQVIPFNLEDGTLDLAVIEPRNVPPISAVAGVRKIIPWIVPEIRVLEALEKYYGVPRRPRYLNLCQELDRSISRSSPTPAPSGGSTLGGTMAAVEPVPLPWSDAVGSPGALATTTEIGEEYGCGKSWKEVARDLFDSEAPEIEAPDSEAPDIEATAARISLAQDKDQLGAAVLDFLAGSTTGSILFSVRSEAARIWDWRGHGFSPDRVRSLRFPVTSGSVFTLLLGNSHYRGPVPNDSGCAWFFNALQIDTPTEIFLAPVHLNDRLVAILYADSGSEGELPDDVDDFLRLTHKLSLALNMLILKMKILQA